MMLAKELKRKRRLHNPKIASVRYTTLRKLGALSSDFVGPGATETYNMDNKHKNNTELGPTVPPSHLLARHTRPCVEISGTASQPELANVATANKTSPEEEEALGGEAKCAGCGRSGLLEGNHH
ncbi:hypothetical protein KOW79_003279 [Hemibagrus wyckioides]|uniref:Uncharacterized protein n=1 Tax=Hemibagrus wyckioides TaxID=337641 RepID=A0A9D3P2W5_9TELE|nr:hypothetical protein KOW79_003279 [Hemibagrus wyckioides]